MATPGSHSYNNYYTGILVALHFIILGAGGIGNGKVSPKLI